MPGIADEPLVSFREMQKSSLLLSDIAALYLPLHGREPLDFFDHYAMLAWVEAQIYAVEIAVERPGADPESCLDLWQRQRTRILDLLAAERLHVPRIESILDDVGDYFALVIQRLKQGKLSHCEVVKAAELRQSDLRLLHAILLRRLGLPPDDILLSLLWPLEVSWELQANVVEQEEDRATGHFNPYLLLGPDALATEQRRLNNLFEHRMAQASPELQQRMYGFIGRYRQAYPLQSQL